MEELKYNIQHFKKCHFSIKYLNFSRNLICYLYHLTNINTTYHERKKTKF